MDFPLPLTLVLTMLEDEGTVATAGELTEIRDPRPAAHPSSGVYAASAPVDPSLQTPASAQHVA